MAMHARTAVSCATYTQVIIKGWVPQDKRNRSLSMIYSGHQIGSILALLISPLLLAHSVEMLFYM